MEEGDRWERCPGQTWKSLLLFPGAWTLSCRSGEPWKGLPRGKAIRSVSWAAPLASVWGAIGDRAEQEAWRRGESRKETDDEKVAS